jgi:hypothetical protein
MRWVVCTATPRVRSILDDLDLPSRTLRAAVAEYIGEEIGPGNGSSTTRRRLFRVRESRYALVKGPRLAGGFWK